MSTDKPHTNAVQRRLAELADKYAVTNATGTHGRVKPWLLSPDERSIELLERVRRLENLVVRIADVTGAERNHKQEPGAALAEAQQAGMTSPDQDGSRRYAGQQANVARGIGPANVPPDSSASLFQLLFGGTGRVPK